MAPLILSYAGCQTCRKALAWFAARRIAVTVRPIVDEPPTIRELRAWIPASGRPVRKWLNVTGASYRALDKSRLASADDDAIVELLSRDGKLVKRPIVVAGERVVVGFDEAIYEATFGPGAR